MPPNPPAHNTAPIGGIVQWGRRMKKSGIKLVAGLYPYDNGRRTLEGFDARRIRAIMLVVYPCPVFAVLMFAYDLHKITSNRKAPYTP